MQLSLALRAALGTQVAKSCQGSQAHSPGRGLERELGFCRCHGGRVQGLEALEALGILWGHEGPGNKTRRWGN